MTIAVTEAPATQKVISSALEQLGITERDCGFTDLNVLDVQGEGEVVGRIHEDSVELTVHPETMTLHVKDFRNTKSFIREVDYYLRYILTFQSGFHQSVPTSFQAGGEINA